MIKINCLTFEKNPYHMIERYDVAIKIQRWWRYHHYLKIATEDFKNIFSIFSLIYICYIFLPPPVKFS